MSGFLSQHSAFGPGIEGLEEVDFTFIPEGIPEELKQRRQWVCWSHIKKIDQKTQEVSPAKCPVFYRQGQIRISKWGAEQYWLTFEKARAVMDSADGLIHGLGFIFTKEDPFTFIDFDKMAVDDSRLQWINGRRTFCEWSQSGRGFHMVVKGKAHRTLTAEETNHQVEVYSEKRFCAMTGKLGGERSLDVLDDQPLIDALFERYQGANGSSRRNRDGERVGPRFKLPDTVEEGSRNATILSYIGQLYSEGSDRDTVLALALEANDERFKPPLDASIVTDQVMRMGDLREEERSMQQAEAEDFIDRYFFVAPQDKFYDTHNHTILTPNALNFVHGNAIVDPQLATRIKRSDHRTIVDGLMWMPAPYGETEMRTINDSPRVYANTWEGFGLTPVDGDTAPFHALMRHLISDDEQRNNLWQWMCFAIQKPHIKCNWQVVLHGVSGAGKDALMTPISSIFGNAAGVVGNADVKSAYDDGFIGKKLVCISEVNGISGDSIEHLKRLGASENNAKMILNPKGKGQVEQYNLFAMMFITNHVDALHLSPDERRFYVLYAPDKMPQGLQDEYFEWLQDKEGAAKIFAEVLNEDLSKFDPNKLPKHTNAFHNMVTTTKKMFDELLEDMHETGEGEFSFDIVNAQNLVNDLQMRHNIRTTTGKVKAKLRELGFVQFEFQIQKLGEKPKSRSHMIKANHEYSKLNITEVWDLIDRMEKLKINTIKGQL